MTTERERELVARGYGDRANLSATEQAEVMASAAKMLGLPQECLDTVVITAFMSETLENCSVITMAYGVDRQTLQDVFLSACAADSEAMKDSALLAANFLADLAELEAGHVARVRAELEASLDSEIEEIFSEQQA